MSEQLLGLGRECTQARAVPTRCGELVAVSRAMQRVFADIALLGREECTVLVTGESGTGKELVARALHALSHRSHHPFKAINCAAMPRELVEGTLFGVKKGAFTGACESPGTFLGADKGTLLLDEMGELPLDQQAKLLRVLETHRVTPVGAVTEVPVDVRIVAATNRDLPECIRLGLFRADLYHRLYQGHIHIPPLRERPEDIQVLARLFLSQSQDKPPRGLTDEAIRVLRAYPWPGNGRELRNALTRAGLRARARTVLTGDDIRRSLETLGSPGAHPRARENHAAEGARPTRARADGSGGAIAIPPGQVRVQPEAGGEPSPDPGAHVVLPDRRSRPAGAGAGAPPRACGHG